MPDDARYYINDTGTGNTLNMSHPCVLQMVTDSLRYWSNEMGVDGFRFDLATILGREPHGFDEGGGFLNACRQDPTLLMATLTIAHGTAASRVAPMIPRSSNCATDRCAICSPRCSWLRARPCCWPGMNSPGLNGEATTLIARTVRSVGSTGTSARKALNFKTSRAT